MHGRFANHGAPVFLKDPTYPHRALVTIAQCTAPRRLIGRTDAPVRILTHFESDFGEAPKVEMRGFHWMTSYTGALKETGCAVKKIGIEWLNLTAKG